MIKLAQFGKKIKFGSELNHKLKYTLGLAGFAKISHTIAVIRGTKIAHTVAVIADFKGQRTLNEHENGGELHLDVNLSIYLVSTTRSYC